MSTPTECVLGLKGRWVSGLADFGVFVLSAG
jgi:hypothetical protein